MHRAVERISMFFVMATLSLPIRAKADDDFNGSAPAVFMMSNSGDQNEGTLSSIRSTRGPVQTPFRIPLHPKAPPSSLRPPQRTLRMDRRSPRMRFLLMARSQRSERVLQPLAQQIAGMQLYPTAGLSISQMQAPRPSRGSLSLLLERFPHFQARWQGESWWSDRSRTIDK